MSAPVLRRVAGSSAAVVTVFLTLAAGGAAPAAAAGCGTVSASSNGGFYEADARIVFVRGVSCSRARTIAKRCLRSKRVPGWRVIAPNATGRTAFKLIRGRRTIGIGGPIAGSTPYCAQQVFASR